MNIHHTNEPEVKWSSWLAPLLACYASTDNKNLVEVGIGHFSTPALHALVLASGGVMVSLEDCQAWMDGFVEKFNVNGSHLFFDGDYDASLKEVVAGYQLPTRYGVGFIDESPGGARRAKSFKALIDKCDFVVVHDYWNENIPAIGPMLGDCSWAVANHFEPPTLIASKTKKVPAHLL
jgi:hypothetical protein